MSQTSSIGDVRATMRFIDDSPKWTYEKPYLILHPNLGAECPLTNIDFVERTCVVKDLRSTKNEPTLDPEFFRLVNHESKHLDSLRQEDNGNPYMHETVDLLKNLFNTDCVIAYNTRFRRNQNTYRAPELTSAGTYREPDAPSHRAHVDVSRDSGRQRIGRYLNDEEAQKYLHQPDKWRMRIVNVWRPLCNEVEDTPLAFCDPRSVNVEDLKAVDRPGEFYTGEMYILQHAPDQRWFYLSLQKPHEVFVFVTWDSDAKELSASGIPHTAFNLLGWEDVANPRESVEVRAIVIEPRENETSVTDSIDVYR